MSYAFDAELRAFLDLLPTPGSTDLAASRAMVDEMARAWVAETDTTGLTIFDRMIPGAPGDPDVGIRVFVPESAPTPAPTILSVHGGGFTVGSIDLEHRQVADLARDVGAIVVSVEYRLAPEHPYPAALHDCYVALEWLAENAEELQVRRDRIALVGNSAGGGLVAGLALLARDRGGPAVCFQYLGIPELDHRLETVSMQRFVDTPMWTRAQAERSWAWYLGDLAGDVPAYASPARATDLSGLPPTYISTMEFDPLRDEGIIYGLRLLEAGVSVELHSFPGTWHGCRSMPAAITKRDVDEMVVVLRRALFGC